MVYVGCNDGSDDNHHLLSWNVSLSFHDEFSYDMKDYSTRDVSLAMHRDQTQHMDSTILSLEKNGRAETNCGLCHEITKAPGGTIEMHCPCLFFASVLICTNQFLPLHLDSPGIKIIILFYISVSVIITVVDAYGLLSFCSAVDAPLPFSCMLLRAHSSSNLQQSLGSILIEILELSIWFNFSSTSKLVCIGLGWWMANRRPSYGIGTLGQILSPRPVRYQWCDPHRLGLDPGSWRRRSFWSRWADDGIGQMPCNILHLIHPTLLLPHCHDGRIGILILMHQHPNVPLPHRDHLLVLKQFVRRIILVQFFWSTWNL